MLANSREFKFYHRENDFIDAREILKYEFHLSLL